MKAAIPLSAFRTEQSLMHRRLLIVGFLLSLLVIPVGAARFDSQSLGAVLPLLLCLLLLAYTAHGLFSNAYRRNRLFSRPDHELDEYERHERNAVYAAVFRRAWWLPLLMLGLAGIGKGIVPLLGVEAPPTVSLWDALLLGWITFLALPRLYIAWTHRTED